MSEQIIDLRSTWAILRRRVGTLIVAASVGALAGGAAVYLRPPVYSSTSIVLLPPPQGSGSSAPSHSVDTQVQIAESESVFGPAGKAVTPRLDPAQVADHVTVEAPTADVLTITATGTTPGKAEALSEAVAKSEVDYLKAAASSLGQDARNALAARASTLQQSLDSVSAELKKTESRLAAEPGASPAGKVDAAALSELTAQQAKLVLQLDQIQKQTTSTGQGGAQAGSEATVIQHATPAVRMSLALRLALFEGIGAAATLFLTGLVIVIRGRRERTMRSRDEIADAIGIPVVASIHSRAPHSVAGWTSLLAKYSPGTVETWTLRQLVRLVTPGHPGSLAERQTDRHESPAVVVLTLSDDLRALAVGPQLASFAASTGLATRLVTAQPHASANGLWAACSGLPAEAQPRPGLSVESRSHLRHSGDLVVHVAVLDRLHPELHLRGTEDAVTLLAVTAGTPSADDLARVALAADDSGHPIARIVVVDPDPLDRTTGRVLPSERAQHAPLPSLMTGSAIVSEATPLEQRRRLR
ncbi:Wzz/FepE/Etk N-terminal domain-containing protein [Pedococcus sp. 5OH_020]|uniref:Wzz/FepE/Etk N-terminal domain-containing protein n=1 Tax=Pedococcus sp. 5OH_020 TaxID=2989814 RepID=UPI0022E9DA8B|nr:Wzz/FepE/Etk N-terminal domain-containing protein [Pedococcus sp. 5OH_020]